MFADPQGLTYNTVAKSLVRISAGEDSSIYRLDDSGNVYTFQISHQFGKRNRFVAKVTRESTAADPLDDNTNIATSASVTLSIDVPVVGVPAADASYLAQMLIDWASDANIAKLCAGET